MNLDNSKQCFYQGQHVLPEHLNKLQDFSLSVSASMTQELVGYGVVYGFEIEKTSSYTIGVHSGLAYNHQGIRLPFSEGSSINLTNIAPSVGEKIIKIGIVLDYTHENPVIDNLGNTIYRKQTPIAKIIAEESLGLEAFEIGQVTISASEITTIKHTAQKFRNPIDLVLPIGAPYYQVIGQHSDPQTLYPNTVWEKLYNGESVTVRTGGVLSDESRDPITGIQEDAMQLLIGTVDVFPSWNNSNTGVFSLSGGTYRGSLLDNLNGNLFNKVNFDNSRQARTSTENRMRNVLWNIWIRRG